MTIIMHHTKEQQEEIIQGLSTLCVKCRKENLTVKR